MARRYVTDAQWGQIRPHLPPTTRRPTGWRPLVAPRRCIEEMLWILWTGAP